MVQYMSAIPAYGRDYKSKKEVMEAWAEGKDFQLHHLGRSTYININDKPKDLVLNIRYDKQRKVCVLK